MEREEVKMKLFELAAQGVEVPRMEMIKTPEQIAGIREAGRLNTEVLDAVEKAIHVGMTTEEIDRIVYEYTVSHDATPACLNFEGFPKSVCTSVNDVICHGIPSSDVVLKNGDIVNVDATTIYKGYVGDASRMFMLGNVPNNRRNLVGITKECLRRGMQNAVGWKNTLGDIARPSSPLPGNTAIPWSANLAVMVWGFPCMKILLFPTSGKKERACSLCRAWSLPLNP